MNRKLISLGIILTILGLLGVASILTMEVSIPAEMESTLKEKFTDDQIKFLTLINPTIMLLIAVVVGTLLYQRVRLTVPLIEKMTGIKNASINVTEIFGYGILGGVVSGVLLSLNGYIFNPILPGEFKALGEVYQPTMAVRFLYGGLTEEILMRFGLMTLIVWVLSKILSRTTPIVYWTGIIIAAIIFATGHFPVAFQAVGNPSPGLLAYILIGNSVGGVIFGWLYWKKGLESAFVAHIFAHVIMLLAMSILN